MKKDFNTSISEKPKMMDPTHIKVQKQGSEPQDGKKSPWEFRCPQYDQRSSNFLSAGTHYGVGINQPVGHEGAPKQRVAVLPYGHHETMRSDEEG